jgi:type VI protein secretion system component VasK
MRLWLRDSERLPDPPPMKTDDRAALAVGTALWAIAAVVALVLAGPLAASGHGWVVTATIVGVVLGLIGVVYAQVRRSRARRRECSASAGDGPRAARPEKR